jgi:hypothetical protein
LYFNRFLKLFIAFLLKTLKVFPVNKSNSWTPFFDYHDGGNKNLEYIMQNGYNLAFGTLVLFSASVSAFRAGLSAFPAVVLASQMSASKHI